MSDGISLVWKPTKKWLVEHLRPTPPHDGQAYTSLTDSGATSRRRVIPSLRDSVASDIPPFSSMISMVKEKVTITLDRRKADEARRLVGARSTSEIVGVALDHLIGAERLRQDIAAYRQVPPSSEESALAALADTAALADETDWEALYADAT